MMLTVDVLAIAAHPDDVEQTCGGTLIRAAEAGYRAGVLDLTAGDMGTRGTPELRIEESESAAKHMLLAWRGNVRFPDARLENTLTARITLAVKIRELKPRVVILPYWAGRHPDHYRCAEMAYEACFLAGLKKLDECSGPHRPQKTEEGRGGEEREEYRDPPGPRKILYASLYADVKPSFIVDISAQFERRMTALLSYVS